MKLDHPGGMTPFMMPRGTPDIPKSHPQRRAVWNSWVRDPSLTSSSTFHEATGETGDVYILHPFMLHSASRNLLRTLRIITNPPVSLKEPFNYNRADPADYSLVEQKTLRDLGRPEGLGDWKITGPRERIVPKERVEVSHYRLESRWSWCDRELRVENWANMEKTGTSEHEREGSREIECSGHPSEQGQGSESARGVLSFLMR